VLIKKVETGLDRLFNEPKWKDAIRGNVGYLCHAASVDNRIIHGIDLMKSLFGDRLTCLFSPQHGLFGDAQDDMIESDHTWLSHYNLPVYSLYSETRIPKPEMLEGLDHMIIDLQNIGWRAYTYIFTMTLMMEACARAGVEVIVLDRPNPVNGTSIEGNLLDPSFRSFVGLHPLPFRYGMTIGEIAIYAKKYWGINVPLTVVPMSGWERNMHFSDTGLPWVLPSPNLSNPETAFTFGSTVFFEGVNFSEGRGTTKSLEMIGHPKMEHFRIHSILKEAFSKNNLKGITLRPVTFVPTFQKFQDEHCHGYQLHITDNRLYQPWRTGQVLCQVLYHEMGDDFTWKQPPFEYEYEKLPIDILNGTDKLRLWVEQKGEFAELEKIENEGMDAFLSQRQEILLY